ncbi:MAG TPA: retropepsin-like aspartic protease [Verrucomicrobiae bacterium]
MLNLRSHIHLVAAVVAIAWLCASNCRAVGRIWLNGATVNGKPVKVYFDSGAAGILLTKSAVQRLGLNVVDPGTNGPGDTAVYTFKWNDSEAAQTDFVIINQNLDGGADGIVGWYFATGGPVRIDAEKYTISALMHDPWFGRGWTRFPIMTNTGILDIEVPHNDGTKGIISIDTGNPFGLLLAPRLWRQWRDGHPHAPVTCRVLSWAGGVSSQEEMLADKISIGPLVLKNVPVMEVFSNPVEAEWGSEYDGNLGLAALDHVEPSRMASTMLSIYVSRGPSHPLTHIIALVHSSIRSRGTLMKQRRGCCPGVRHSTREYAMATPLCA